MGMKFGVGKTGMVFAAIAAAFIISMCFFVVDENEQAVVSQFGRPVKTVTEPGLYFKLPEPVQVVRRFDVRAMTSESALSEVLTSDKKNLVADYYVVWRIDDPLLFMQTVVDEQGAKYRIGDIVYSEIRSQLGLYELASIINADRDAIHGKVTEESGKKLSKYGISVLDVRIRRLNFPDQNKNSVFSRMRSERTRMANQYRSEGEEEALRIRAETDKERELILSKARYNATVIRGLADANAAKIYANVYEVDPEFYEFIRTMQAYQKIIPSGRNTLIVSSDSKLFKYLDASEGR